MVKLEIRSSTISGRGTFAKEKIKCGELITTLTGERFDTRGIFKVCDERGICDDDPLQVGEDAFLILNYESKAINHSCNPNTCIRHESDLFAFKDIEVGEEITFDYSTTVSPTIVWFMPCQCTATNCRKTIGNVRTIPAPTLARYIEQDALPDFIKRQLGISQKR